MKATSGLAPSPESVTLVWKKAKLRADQLERGDLAVELDANAVLGLGDLADACRAGIVDLVPREDCGTVAVADHLAVG